MKQAIEIEPKIKLKKYDKLAIAVCCVTQFTHLYTYMNLST